MIIIQNQNMSENRSKSSCHCTRQWFIEQDTKNTNDEKTYPGVMAHPVILTRGKLKEEKFELA